MRMKMLLVTAVIFAIIPFSMCTPAEEMDYSFLEDMSIKQLRELDAEIHKLLPSDDPGDVAETEDPEPTSNGMAAITNQVDAVEYMSVDELYELTSSNESKFKTAYMGSIVTVVSPLTRIESGGKIFNKITEQWIDYSARLTLGNGSLYAYYPAGNPAVDYVLSGLNIGDSVVLQGSLCGKDGFSPLVTIMSVGVAAADTEIEDIALVIRESRPCSIFTVPFDYCEADSADGLTFLQLSYGVHKYSVNPDNYDALKLFLKIGEQDPADQEAILELVEESGFEYKVSGEPGTSGGIGIKTDTVQISYLYDVSKDSYPQLSFHDYDAGSEKMNWGIKIRPKQGIYGLYDDTF